MGVGKKERERCGEGKVQREKEAKRDGATETESRSQIRIVWKHPVFQ